MAEGSAEAGARRALDALSQQREEIESKEDSLRPGLRAAYDWEISRLVAELGVQADEGLWLQLTVFQEERKALEGAAREVRSALLAHAAMTDAALDAMDGDTVNVEVSDAFDAGVDVETMSPADTGVSPPDQGPDPPDVVADLPPLTPAEIRLSADGLVLLSGASWDFGVQAVGGATPLLIISVENLGGAALGLDLPVTVTGPDAGHFTLVYGPEAPIPGGESTTLGVVYSPASEGAHSAQLHLAHQGDGPNPYILTLTGAGVSPAEDVPIFLAHAGCCTRYVSTDGLNWTKFEDDLADVPLAQFLYAGGQFMGLGTEAGSSRFVRTASGSYYSVEQALEGTWRRLVAHDGLLVAAGDAGMFNRSTDLGTTWKPAPDVTGDTLTVPLRHGAYGQGKFVFAGAECAPEGAATTGLAVSEDGQTWKLTALGGYCLDEIVFGNGVFVAMGGTEPDQEGAYWDCRWSTNLEQWTSCTDLFEVWPKSTGPHPILFLNGEFIGLGGVRSTYGESWQAFTWATPAPHSLTRASGGDC